MSTRKSLLVAALLALGTTAAVAEGPNLGQPITEADVGAWNLNAMADGSGLPPGSGTPEQGKPLYAQKCAACHGEGGKGGVNAALVGKPPLDSIEAPKTIANFWGYSTTVFDFIRRAMPWIEPRSLTNDEVYAITAYLFAENKLIGPSDVMNAQTLPKVKMPNADNFIIRFPDRI
ncbi:MAG: S-disulfanyl-L-cysteine oxidoreductase SoxD [Alphaproteobacteria bacterium]|jgi:cytochrome c|nr:S-disulfanyl-L-cysteine oxidoreductase SoxD [Alphaproteobacteria bacterium]